jgi:hypothetical protein
MLQDGRGADDNFKRKERLYRRCVNEDLEGERLLAARIPYKDASNNRSKYSRPWDVIFDHPTQGIIQIRVCDLPAALPQEKPKGTVIELHDFRPEHIPLPENYAHSEIRTYRAGSPIARLTAELVKKEFRATMSDCSIILWRPKI